MSTKKVETVPAARLKMLAAIAIAEAEDGRGDPADVKPFMGAISTEDLQQIFAATKYCMIERYIIEELYVRNDMTSKRFLELIPNTSHDSIQDIICEIVKAMPQTAYLSLEDILSLYQNGMLERMSKTLLPLALAHVPKGDLPKIVAQFKSAASAAIYEFKRRNDPVNEGLLTVLTMDISLDARSAIINMLENDQRIKPEHIIDVMLELPENAMIQHLFYSKAKDAPIAKKQVWYQIAKESFQLAIIEGFDCNRTNAISYIDFFISHSRTDSVHAAVVRTFGTHLPLEHLLELRSNTTNKEVADVFSELFGEHKRYHELHTLLAS